MDEPSEYEWTYKSPAWPRIAKLIFFGVTAIVASYFISLYFPVFAFFGWPISVFASFALIIGIQGALEQLFDWGNENVLSVHEKTVQEIEPENQAGERYRTSRAELLYWLRALSISIAVAGPIWLTSDGLNQRAFENLKTWFSFNLFIASAPVALIATLILAITALVKLKDLLMSPWS